MTEISFVIENSQEGERIDSALTNLMGGATRSSIQKLIEKGEVHVNGSSQVSKNYRLKEGDLIKVYFHEPEIIDVKPEDIPICIIYEDNDLLVVNKPKGMVVHPGHGNMNGTLVNAILYHCGERLSSINGIIRPGIVHRLDKDTSGLIVVAKNDNAHHGLAEQFADHSIKRIYKAVVHNNFFEEEGVVDAPIGRDPRNRLRMAVTDKNSKESRTCYRVLERFGLFTLIEASLETGRTHQIRVHMAHIKHPVLGDEIYGPKKRGVRTEGQLLHASILGFKHPSTGEYMEFHSPLPEDFQQILDRLR